MLKILDWVLGREPVAAATGIAAVVTALAGLLTAFDVVALSAEQIAAVGALTAAVAGWAARGAVTPVAGPTERQDRGSIPLALIILVALAVVLLAGLAVCTDAAFEDEDEVNDLGMPALVVDHDRYRCMDHDGCGGEGSDGNTGYDGEGGRSGDMDQGGDNNCRNFCDNIIYIPDPRGGREEQPRV